VLVQEPAPTRPKAPTSGPTTDEIYAPPAAEEQTGGARKAESTSPDGWSAAGVPWVSSTYFGEGLPYSMVHQVAQELFTAFGASLSAIGHTALYGLAWNFKFTWSPLVDLYGTTRRWVIGAQILLGLVLLALVGPAQRGDLGQVALGLVFVSVLAATQDIAVDGFYLEALPPKQQAAFSGLRVGAFRAAMLVGKGGLVILAGVAGGWGWAFGAAAAMMLLLGVGHAFLLPRPAGAVQAAKKRFLHAFATYFKQPGVALALAFILTYRAGDAMMFAMSSPFLRDLSFGTTARGVVSGLGGTSSSIGGAVLGGMIIARFGLERTLRPIAALQSAAILIYTWLAWARPGLVAVVAGVLAEQAIAGIGTAALMVFLMRRCQGEYKASHFAVGSALMSLATTIAGTVSGHIAERVGFTWFFTLAFAASLPGVVLSFFVSTGAAAAQGGKPAAAAQ
jgi:PAT family beta-lactamase induction signal transducer AmpG